MESKIEWLQRNIERLRREIDEGKYTGPALGYAKIELIELHEIYREECFPIVYVSKFLA